MSRRIVVVGAGAGGLKAANRLAWHAASGADLDVLLVDRASEHVFAPGFVPILFGEAEPDSVRRPVADLVHPGVRIVAGEVTELDPAGHAVRGSFGELPYDALILALGAEVGWPEGPPPSGDLSPWTLGGALAGREALRRLGPSARVLLTVPGPGYRCPPAVVDLAVRIRRATGSSVHLAHPWPRPLAPFGDKPAAVGAALLEGAGVEYSGGFQLAEIRPESVVGADGTELPYHVAFVVPPHRPPAVVAGSPLAGGSGWPAVGFPSFAVQGADDVYAIGDLASASLTVGMAGTLAVQEAVFVADRLAEAAGGRPAPAQPTMSAICFLDTGVTGAFLHCDFTGPASGQGPAACTLMPWLPFFRSAKRLFAQEWFDSTLRGDVG